MTGAAARPPRRQLQSRAMNAANVVMRAVLGLPVATPLGKRLMLAYVVGRRTGRIYRQPVSYVRDGDALLTPGGGRWKLNLRPGERVRLRLRGRDVMARAELIGDPDEVDRLLGVIYAANRAASSFVGIARGPDGRLNPEQLGAAVAHGFRIVRWRLDDASEST
jgi:F420H(2)-dependent quinone reductase